MESIHNWLEREGDTSSVEERPQLSPTRNARKERQQSMSTAETQVKPQLSSSCRSRRRAEPELYQHHSGEEYSHITSQSAKGLPEGWLTRRIPRKNTKCNGFDTCWFSPELKLQFQSFREAKMFAERMKDLGKGETAAIHPKSPSLLEDSVKPKLPLAPIFLKNNGKKKKQNDSVHQSPAKSEEPKEASIEPSLSPIRKRLTRKRKQALEDSRFVSDDAISEASLEVFEPRKKIDRTKC